MNENKNSKEEEMTNLERELWEMSSEIFDEEIWNSKTKEELKDKSKKEAAKLMFGLGFVVHQEIMDEQIKEMEQRVFKDPDIAKSIKKFKDKINEGEGR